MRKLYSFAVLLVMLLASTTSKAQNFEGEAKVTFYGSQNYATTPIKFSMTAIADAFGIADAATLAAMLDAQYPEDREDAIDRGFQMYEIQSDKTLFEGIYTEDEKTFTADPIGFYLNKDGDVVNWSSADDIWFYVPRWDADKDEFYFNCGRKAADASFEEGYTGTATFYLRYNGTIALSFKLTYTVEAKPEAAENETQFSKLTILEDKAITVDLSQKPRSSYEADAIEIEVPTLLNDLGISYAEFVMANSLYARLYEYDTASLMYSWTDLITNEYTAGAPGFWFGPTYTYPDEDSDPIANNSDLARHSYSSDCRFYAESFTFTRSEGVDKLSFNVGQYPSNSQGDEVYHATLYLVNGSIAIPIYINLSIERVERKDFADMEEAGTTDVNVTLMAGEATTSTTFTYDVASVLEALGLTAGDAEFYGLESEGVLSTQQTANGGGSWFNGDGYVVAYGSDRAAYIEFNSSKDTFTIGTYAKNDYAAGQELHIDYYMIGMSSYWHFNVTITFKGDDVDYNTWTKKGTLPMTITCVLPTVPYAEYTIEEIDGNVIDMDKVKEMLGSSNITLYTQKYIPAEEEGAEGTVTWTKGYNCDPKPGFWMEKSGKYIGAWGDDASYGMAFEIGSGAITIFQMPNSRQYGDSFRTIYYLADESAETYVELPTTVTFAESLSPIERVGEGTFFLKWTSADDDNFNYVDMQEIVEKVFDGDENSIESAEWFVLNDGVWQALRGFEVEYNYFDAEGNFMGDSESENADDLYFDAAFSVGYDIVEQAFALSTLNNEDWVGDAKLVELAVQYEQKRYFLHVYIGNEEQYNELITAVNSLPTAQGKQQGRVYDLTGRRVDTPAKGLYIVGGKKVLVK